MERYMIILKGCHDDTTFFMPLTNEEKDFLEHIKKHMQGEEGITQNDCSTIFRKDFPTDKVINEIKKDHYIIATDTAFSILSKYNITCDFVLSIDGQSF